MVKHQRPKTEGADPRRSGANRRQQNVFVSIALAAALTFLMGPNDGALAASRAQNNGGGFFGHLFGFKPPPYRDNFYRRQNDSYGRQNSQFWFGPGPPPFWSPDQPSARKPRPARAMTYRTLCVRICDGYYFPISHATKRSRFKTDAAACQSMYPPGEAALYVHHTTGEDATQAVSLTGQPLVKQSFAFAYRSTYDHTCAALFRPGSGALISFRKRPLPDSTVTASLASEVTRQRREQPPKLPDAFSKEDAWAKPDEGALVANALRRDVRMVATASYDGLADRASTGSEPAKIAEAAMPAMTEPPAISMDGRPVAVSSPSNPLELFNAAAEALTKWRQ